MDNETRQAYPMPDDFLDNDKLDILRRLKTKIKDDSIKGMLSDIWKTWFNVLWDTEGSSAVQTTEQPPENEGLYVDIESIINQI